MMVIGFRVGKTFLDSFLTNFLNFLKIAFGLFVHIDIGIDLSFDIFKVFSDIGLAHLGLWEILRTQIWMCFIIYQSLMDFYGPTSAIV